MNNSRLSKKDYDDLLGTIKLASMISENVFSDLNSTREFLGMIGIREFYTEKIDPNGDPTRVYVSNSMGYRGDKEFDSRVDLITTGCSQTWGQGIPEEAMWANILASNLELSHANIAAPGWSVQQIVSSTMSYIQKHGKPKLIVALLPDFGRALVMQLSKVLVLDNPLHVPEMSVGKIQFSGEDSDKPKLSKAPHRGKDVIPTEEPVFRAAQTWAAFMEYCKIGGIELVWTSWDIHVLAMYSLAADICKDDAINFQKIYVDTSNLVMHNLFVRDRMHIDALSGLGCHKDLYAKYPDCFDEGTDTGIHYGAHTNAHLADIFESKIREK